MKKLKFYTTIILIVSMLSMLSVPAFANYSEYSASWLFSPVYGVSGYIYSDSPYGFIIKNYDPETYIDTTALVSDNGVVIPQSEKNFQYITEDGLMSYRTWLEDGNVIAGVMDFAGNDVGPRGYDEVEIINSNLYCCYVENDEGWYDAGVVDAAGNEVIPFGKYSWITWNGLIKCYGDTEVVDIYDMSGNFVASEERGYNVEITSASDRYLYIDYDANKTYIRSIYGYDIAGIEGMASFRGAIIVSRYEEAGSQYVVNEKIYDLDGNLIRNDVYRDNFVRPYSSINLNNASKYHIEYLNGTFGVCDQNGNVVYTNDEIYYIYGGKYIVLKTGEYDWDTNISTEDFSVLDMNGNVIVPFGSGFDDISYCEELDLFAFAKNKQIHIMRPTPITVNVGGNKVTFDQNPVVKESRTLVPLRAIFEALGATVDWNQDTMTVTSTLGDITVSLTIGSNILTVNGEEKALDVPAEVLNGRTLVPVRAISEAFNCHVGWDGNTRTVTID